MLVTSAGGALRLITAISLEFEMNILLVIGCLIVGCTLGVVVMSLAFMAKSDERDNTRVFNYDRSRRALL